MLGRIQELRLVEIELFSYCNRKCGWCPNKFINRRMRDELDFQLFTDLIDELASENYEGAITFSRYNEPLSDTELLNMAISYIKEKMPNCKCITNTNGDYLNGEVLSNLKIDELTIMDYDNKGPTWAYNKLIKCGAEVDDVQEKYIYAHYNNMKILYYLNWQDNRRITDRAGLLEKYKGPERTRPCYEPKYFVGINYDGTVSPCCNIRNDHSKTKPYIIGDLHYNTLEEILNSQKSESFTSKCESADYEGLECCQTCDNIGGRYTRGKGGISYE